MTTHHHGRLRKHKHSILTVAAIIALIGLFLLSKTGEVGGISLPTSVGQPLQIDAELQSLPELEFNRKFDAIEFILGDTIGVVNIGDGILDAQEGSKITLEDYSGKFSFTSKTLVLDGKASKILVNDVGIKKGLLPVKISTEGLEFEELTIPGLDLNDISYKATGELKVDGGKGEFELNEDTLALKNFAGDLSIEDEEINLVGKVSELAISDITIRK